MACTRDLTAEVVERHLDGRPALGVADDGGAFSVRCALRATSQSVLRIIEPGAAEPPRARHLPGGENLGRLRARHYLEVIPDSRPEPFEVFDRPRPRRLVVGQV